MNIVKNKNNILLNIILLLILFSFLKKISLTKDHKYFKCFIFINKNDYLYKIIRIFKFLKMIIY